jgi:hypothetical protein
MNPVEILYTPLNTPELPDIDILKLKTWIALHPHYDPTYDAKHRVPSDLYPWNLGYAKESGKWLHGFDKEFPEFSEYISSAFGLRPDDIGAVGLLHTKSDFEGLGFWHGDVDSTGLRIYIENEEIEDFLLIKPTIKPYNHYPSEKMNGYPAGINSVGDSPQIQNNIIHSVKLLNPTQCFYLNSVRGVHAAKTNKKGCSRITCLLGINTTMSAQEMPDQLKKLIVNSATKYKDHAIMWTPPIEK